MVLATFLLPLVIALLSSSTVRAFSTNQVAMRRACSSISRLAAALDVDEELIADAEVVNTDGMPLLSMELDGMAAVDVEEEQFTEDSYQRGLATIGFITLLFASNSPALRSVFDLSAVSPPVLLINSGVTLIGLLGVVLTAPLMNQVVVDIPKTDLDIGRDDSNFVSRIVGLSTYAGFELGLWKTIGTTLNIYGLSATSSDHGAFLIQLTTLIVPTIQGIQGVPIPPRIWGAIGLALGGVFIFSQDPSQVECASVQGDLLCALAAVFYATYDLRLFKWGKIVKTNELITTKMVTQSALSLGLLVTLSGEETRAYIAGATSDDVMLAAGVVIWSGLAVNCVAPYLQVSGQQAVGPSRAQILYASQPLWAAVLSFVFLHEAFGTEGLIGGSLFLVAMFLAATAEMPDPNCPAKECEV